MYSHSLSDAQTHASPHTGIDSHTLVSARLQLICQQSTISNVGSLLLACISAGVLWPTLPSELLIVWISAFLSLFLIRNRLYAYCRKRYANQPPSSWLPWLSAASIAGGSLWGMLGLTINMFWQPLYIVYLIAVLVGVAAAAIPAYASSLRIYSSFVFPALLPLILKLFLFGDPVAVGLASIGILYIGALFYAARNYTHHVIASLRLRDENQDLVQHLRQVNNALYAEVSEHRDTLQELRNSEQRLRNLLEGSIQGMLIHRDWQPLFANHSFAEMLGFDSVDEVLALESVEHLFSVYELKNLQTYRYPHSASDTLVHYQIEAVTKYGQALTLQSVVRSVIWENQPALQISVIDISEQVRAAQTLHRVEENYRQIFATITDATVLFDAETLQIVDANPAALQLYGYNWEEFSTLKILDLAADVAHTNEAIELVKRDKQLIGRTSSHKRKNGDLITIEVNVSSFEREDRRLVCCVIRDIGERIEAEEALRDSEERFRDFAETAADFFWETNSELRYTYVSERYQEVTGLTPEQLLGRTRSEVFRISVEEQEKWRTHQADLAAHRPFKDLEVNWVRPEDGSIQIFRNSAKPIFDHNNQFMGYRGVVRNVTEAYNLSRQLSYQASHDSLTGLVNRAEFENRLQRALHNVDRHEHGHVLCYLDLDQFKLINDTSGHAAGDELLRQISVLLQARVRKADTLARLGGDEFAVLMENCSLEKAKEVADALRRTIEEFQFLWDNNKFNIGVSIGVVPITDPNERYAELLRAADSACYAAKDMGRNRVQVYHIADQELAKRQGEMQWVTRINQAMEDQRFVLNFQAIVPAAETSDDHGIHYELLLRMADERGVLIPPGGYLPAAERYNLVTKLDRWVVNTAIDWLCANPEHLQHLHLCSINLSGHSLGNDEFLQFIVEKLGDNPMLDPSKLCFEITETAAIANLASATRFIHELKKLGCMFSLDDFGSGLSSFAYLKNLPVDFLKIDGLFVRDIVHDPIDFAMVKSINEIGKVMGKQTIAEFVESSAIANKLRHIGVDFLQGHFIGEPKPLGEMSQPESQTIASISAKTLR